MSLDYLDTNPDAVSSSGRSTANTSSDWSGWASHSEVMLRNAAGGARSTKVTNAFETYLSQWRPTLQNMATRATNLGSNAVTASYTVDGADQDGAGLLGLRARTGQQQASELNRPVNGPY